MAETKHGFLVLADISGFTAFVTATELEKQRELEADDSCSCNACHAVGRLRLKAIGHYGAFLEHTVGGRMQSAGPDVILAHRLLKNGLARSGDYALLTRRALQYMDVDPAHLCLQPHTERYEHFGEVECLVQHVAELA